MKRFIYIFVVLTLTAITLFGAEIVHYYYTSHSGQAIREFAKVIHGDLYWTVEKGMGYTCKGQGIYKTIRTQGHKIISDSLVTMDCPMRFVPGRLANKNSDQNIILYGGSYVFGLGLNDEDTLGANLQAKVKNVNVYNLAIAGWGAHQLLRLLELERLKPSLANNQGGWVVYGLIQDHIDRMLHHPRIVTYMPANPDSPYYQVRDKEILYQGTFRENFPLYTSFLEAINRTSMGNKLLFASRWLKPLEEQKMICRLVQKSAKILREQLNYKLVIFYYPTETIDPSIDQCLRQYATVFDYSDQLKDLRQQNKLTIGSHDSHPSALANKRLAELLKRDLDLE